MNTAKPHATPSSSASQDSFFVVVLQSNTLEVDSTKMGPTHIE